MENWNRVPCGESGQCVEYMRVPCDTNACVEYGQNEHGEVLFRTSVKPENIMIATVEETRAFRDAVKAGWLDGI